MTQTTPERSAYMRDYYRQYGQAARGHRALRDAAPVIDRIQECLDLGMTITAIAATAGVADATIRRVLATPGVRVRASVADAILTVRPTRPVTPIGLTRRVRALACLGWSTTVIARTAGLHVDTVKEVRRRPRVELKAITEPLLTAYDALAMRTPTATDRFERSAVAQVRARAAAAGWAPPLAWDDDTIDDPAATPDRGDGTTSARHDEAVDDAVITRVLDGTPTRTTTAERARLIPTLAARGLPDGQIAALCCTTENTVYRTRTRLGVRSQWGTAA